MLADTPTFGHSTAFVRQEGLKKLTLSVVDDAVVGQLDLKRTARTFATNPAIVAIGEAIIPNLAIA